MATLPILLILGCAKGTIVLDGDDSGLTGGQADGGTSSDGGGADGGSGDGGSGTGDGGSGTGDGGTGDGGGGSDGGGDGGGGDGGAGLIWTGLYSGALTLDIDSEYGAYEVPDCPTAMVVDTDHVVSGGATCSIYGSEVSLPFDGSISDSGELVGTSTIDLGWGSSVELALSGTIDSAGSLPLVVDGELVSSWSTATVHGEGELSRE